jgi:hypothetical protein
VRHNPSMQAAFPLVLFGSIALFVVVGLLSMLTRSNLYDQIGQGGLSMGEDQLDDSRPTQREPLGPGGSERSGGADGLESRAEREREIRQMLQARSDRLVRKGHAPLDIDAELARLEYSGAGGPGNAGGSGGTGGFGSTGLAAEVRQLVVARNERRQRQGQDPLDVEAEVQRTLAELDP